MCLSPLKKALPRYCPPLERQLVILHWSPVRRPLQAELGRQSRRLQQAQAALQGLMQVQSQRSIHQQEVLQMWQLATSGRGCGGMPPDPSLRGQMPRNLFRRLQHLVWGTATGLLSSPQSPVQGQALLQPRLQSPTRATIQHMGRRMRGRQIWQTALRQAWQRVHVLRRLKPPASQAQVCKG